MRVGLVIERLDPWRGGAETSAWQFVNHLLTAGTEVTIFTRTRLAPFPGCHIHHIRTSTRLRGRMTAEFLKRSALACRRADLDIVHALSPCYAADVYEPRGGTVMETIIRNVAVRRTRMGQAVKTALVRMNNKQQILLRAERRLLRRDPPPVVVAISRYVVQQLDQHYGVNGDAIRLIFNGVDPIAGDEEARQRDRDEIRKSFSVPRGAYLLLMVAHNFKLKGLRQTIEALARLAALGQVDPVLLIVGHGKPAAYRRQADRLGVSRRLRFVGDTERISAFYHAADVLVHPTFYDPCSRVVLEALSAGLPCVTTRWNGAAEIMTDGEQGFIIDSPHDTNALTERLQQLAEPGLRDRCGQAARRLRGRLGMEAHAAGVRALYEELLERRRK